jgi:hypothetical protein
LLNESWFVSGYAFRHTAKRYPIVSPLPFAEKPGSYQGIRFSGAVSASESVPASAAAVRGPSKKEFFSKLFSRCVRQPSG